MQPNAATVVLSQLPARQDEARAWRRFVGAVVLILAIAGIYTCWCDTPMIWDGSYQFCFSLIRRKPYFYLTRFHSYVLWTPMIWLTHVTQNLTVLKMAYGLPFALAPAFSVLVSWWVVRKHNPRLILWGIFGVAAATLPGQIFIINDSIFQQHLFWPVFLGLLVPFEWPQIVALSLLAVFQFSHQIGVVLLSGGAAAAGLLAIRDREHRRELLMKAVLFVGLAAIALWKIFHFPDSYAQREFTWERAHEAWRWGVEGYPLRGEEFMWAVGVCVLMLGLLRGGPRWQPYRRMLRLAAGLCILGAVVNWTIWALDSHKWSTAVNYRRWVVPLTVPFYVLGLLDAWRGARPAQDKPGALTRAVLGHTPLDPFTVRIGLAVACAFALVLSIQSWVWFRLSERLLRDVESYPSAIVPWSTIDWTADTPMYHWGTASYVFVLEGRQPRKLVLDPDREDAVKQLAQVYRDPPAVPLSWFTPVNPNPGPAGWFDFRAMLKQIREPRPVQGPPRTAP